MMTYEDHDQASAISHTHHSQAIWQRPASHDRSSHADTAARTAALPAREVQKARLLQTKEHHAARISQTSLSPSAKIAVVLKSPHRQSASTQSRLPQLWEQSRLAKRKAAVGLKAAAAAAEAAALELDISTAPSPATSNRGRPKGWKPGMSYAVMRGNDPHNKAPRHSRPKLPGVSRRPGRPPRPPSPTARQLYERTDCHFVSFLCEWQDCKAELQNAETLRRHVRVVHAPTEGRVCRWGQCTADGFKDTPCWQAHLEKAHLVPLTWHVGDGPRNTSSAKLSLPSQVPDYLYGADGQQVTPSIKDQELEDFATWRENRRKLKELLIQRDNNLPDESSESSDGSSGALEDAF